MYVTVLRSWIWPSLNFGGTVYSRTIDDLTYDGGFTFLFLKVMTHVVDALGSEKGPDLDRIALAMVDVATMVGSDEAVSKR